MTAAWPNSTTQGGREWITPTARGMFYAEIKSGDQQTWFNDNEGKVWRWPADDAVTKLKADMRAHEAKHADDPAPAEPSISISFMKDETGKDMAVEALTLGEFAERIQTTTARSKGALPLIKMAGFGDKKSPKGSLRYNANLLTITGVEGDYDAKKMSFDAAVEIAKKTGLKSLLYTTPSYTDDEPKWRLLCPTSGKLPAQDRDKLIARVNGVYGGIFAPESFTLSQPYYIGSIDNNPMHRVVIVGGDCIDQRNDLDARAIGRPKATAKAADGADTEVHGYEQHIALIGDGDGLRGFNAVMLSASAAYAIEHGKEFDREELKTKLRAAINAAPKMATRDVSVYLGDTYLNSVIEGAVEKFAADKEEAEPEIEPTWSHLMTRDPKDIPRRPWQIEGLLMLAVVTILCGHGGAGKSLWSLYIALMCALAQEWAGYVPKEAINVLVVNAEDGTDELDMRLESALQSFKGRTSELRKIASERIHTVKIPNYFLVSKEGDKGPKRTAFFMTLLEYIREHKIGLLIFDPAVSAHYGLDENSAEMQFLIESFRILAVTCNIPVLLVHHYKKSGIAGDANSARGSSTMIDAARIVVTVDPMDAKEAGNMLTDVEQRGSYFSTTLGKANYSRKAPRQWFRIDGTILPNGESAPRLIVTEFGGDGETMSDADMEDFLDMVTEGRGKGKLYTPGGHDAYRLDYVLRDKFNIPRDRANAIIGNLTKCGVLGLVDYDRGDNKQGKGYAVLKRSADATQVLM